MMRFLRLLAVLYFCIALRGIAAYPGEFGATQYFEAALAIANIILFAFWRVWFPKPAAKATSAAGDQAASP